MYYYNARWYDREIGRFISADTYKGELEYPQTLNLYVYVLNNPLVYVDPSGNIVETAWDAISLGTGVVSLYSSIKDRDWQGALLDTAGILADTAALLVPALPGGAEAGIKTIRATRTVADVADVMGGVREIKQGYEKDNKAQIGLGVLQATAGIGGRVISNTDIAKASANLGDDIGSGLKGTGKGGVGLYKDVKGHHIHAKAAFKGHVSYDMKKGLSISQDFMKGKGWSHSDMTRKQRQLFKELFESGRPNTLQEHTNIAIEALQAGGATLDESIQLVNKSIRNLVEQGVDVPTKIPWHTK